MAEYRIDDLAKAAGTTTRNVRGYQDRGLLPRPLRRGRIAIYTEKHLDRLTLINNLLGRGFTARHIADFIRGMQRGDDLAQILGVNDILRERWSTSETEAISTSDLRALLDSDDHQLYAQLGDIGLIQPTDDGYVLLDRDTIRGMGRLVALGLKADAIARVFVQLQGHVDDAATEMISAASGEFTAQRGEGWVPTGPEESQWAAELMSEMRSTATSAAHNALNRALDTALRDELKDYLDRSLTDDSNRPGTNVGVPPSA